MKKLRILLSEVLVTPNGMTFLKKPQLLISTFKKSEFFKSCMGLSNSQVMVIVRIFFSDESQWGRPGCCAFARDVIRTSWGASECCAVIWGGSECGFKVCLYLPNCELFHDPQM